MSADHIKTKRVDTHTSITPTIAILSVAEKRVGVFKHIAPDWSERERI